MAYVNVHFAEKIPGWETIRGRTYIVEGPPTSIKRDDSGEHPIEIWRYDTTLKGTRAFKFVDECDCGEFKLLNPADQADHHIT